MSMSTRRRGRATAALAAVFTAVLALSGCGSSPSDEAAPGGTPGDELRVVDLLDTTFDLGAPIGEAVGRGPQAEELVAEAQRSIDELGRLVQQSGVAGETVSPMRLDVPSFGVLALIPPSIGSSIIADVGLAQPAAQTTDPSRLGGVADYYALTEISLENLPEHDADVIIALVRGGADPTTAGSRSPPT